MPRVSITGPPEQREERIFVYEDVREPQQIERIREECSTALSVDDLAGLSQA